MSQQVRIKFELVLLNLQEFTLKVYVEFSIASYFITR